MNRPTHDTRPEIVVNYVPEGSTDVYTYQVFKDIDERGPLIRALTKIKGIEPYLSSFPATDTVRVTFTRDEASVHIAVIRTITSYAGITPPELMEYGMSVFDRGQYRKYVMYRHYEQDSL